MDEFAAAQGAANAFTAQFKPGSIVTFSAEQTTQYDALRDRVKRATKEWEMRSREWLSRRYGYRPLE